MPQYVRTDPMEFQNHNFGKGDSLPSQRKKGRNNTLVSRNVNKIFTFEKKVFGIS